MAVVVCIAMAVAGCEMPEAQPDLTPQQVQLRQQRERWNQTVLTGAVAGAALGAGIGALAGHGSTTGVLIGLFAGLAAGAAAGKAVADRNMKFENRELSAQQRIDAAKQTTAELQQAAALSENIVRSNEEKLAALDAQYKAEKITAAKYRAEAQNMTEDAKQIRAFAEDAKKAREKIDTSSAQVPALAEEGPKMEDCQRRLQDCADQLEAKLAQLPAAR